CRMLSSDSLVDRSASVSSMRRISVPSWPRASSQLKRAVRALPTWSCPVGLGAKRNLMIFRGASPLVLPDTRSRSPLRRLAPIAWLASRRSLAGGRGSSLPAPNQRHGMRGNRVAAADGIHALVRLSLDAHRGDLAANGL